MAAPRAARGPCAAAGAAPGRRRPPPRRRRRSRPRPGGRGRCPGSGKYVEVAAPGLERLARSSRLAALPDFSSTPRRHDQRGGHRRGRPAAPTAAATGARAAGPGREPAAAPAPAQRHHGGDEGQRGEDHHQRVGRQPERGEQQRQHRVAAVGPVQEAQPEQQHEGQRHRAPQLVEVRVQGQVGQPGCPARPAPWPAAPRPGPAPRPWRASRKKPTAASAATSGGEAGVGHHGVQPRQRGRRRPAP